LFAHENSTDTYVDCFCLPDMAHFASAVLLAAALLMVKIDETTRWSVHVR